MRNRDDKTTGVELEGLSTRDSQIAMLVASGKSYEEIATELRISKSTVFRATKNVYFRKAVDGFRDATISQGLGLLFQSFKTAAIEITRLAKEGVPADCVKLGAARSILESVLKWRDTELIRRVEELEEQIGGSSVARVELNRQRLKDLGFDADELFRFRMGSPPTAATTVSPPSTNGNGKPHRDEGGDNDDGVDPYQAMK